MDISIFFTPAQLVGYTAMGLSIVSYKMRNRDSILGLSIFSGILWVLHFYMLESMTATIMNIIYCVQNIIFFQRTKFRWAASSIWLYIFLLLHTANGWLVSAYEGPKSFLGVGGILMVTFSMWLRDPAFIRITTMGSRPLLLFYHAIIGSYPGVINALLTLASTLIGIWRHDRTYWKKRVSHRDK